ncbi:FK506-binding protein 2 [Aplysia californica]|uniref:peptidylprolyl isomerase n=1 Tax=Aplysia californica TaxID=6500 RepID=A0ABM0K5S3_APLCA|nr:FK506-binding protein 2 [Aplysia californica]
MNLVTMSWSGIVNHAFFLYFLFSLHGIAASSKDLQIKTEYEPEECSEKSAMGDTVAVHYTGYLENGKVFDSSIKRNRDPIAFTLGRKQVIDGWEQGLVGMCVGEKRRLVIPPHLAYGESGYPPAIPPQATLLFETTLVSITKNSSSSPYQVEDVLSLVKVLGPPLVIGYLCYYMYSKYKEEAQIAKSLKKQKKKR